MEAAEVWQALIEELSHLFLFRNPLMLVQWCIQCTIAPSSVGVILWIEYSVPPLASVDSAALTQIYRRAKCASSDAAHQGWLLHHESDGLMRVHTVAFLARLKESSHSR